MARTPHDFRYRIRNWREYDRALINRDRLTLWFDENAIATWLNTEPASGPGAPRLYADLAIQCTLVLKVVFHLSLRATQGLLSSVSELMALALPVPDYSTVSRRQGALQESRTLTPWVCPRPVAIAATGLKVYGAREWHAWKNRAGRRRTWRKLHLGIDAATKEIIAVELTESQVHDSQQLPSLLEQIPDPVAQVSGDGTYDMRACYEAVLQRGAAPTFVPRRMAQSPATPDPTGWRAARNHVLQQIEDQGRYAWRVVRGCARQSIAENMMFRIKTLFGERLSGRNLDTQRVEALVKCAVLNRMTQLGMPESVRVV